MKATTNAKAVALTSTGGTMLAKWCEDCSRLTAGCWRHATWYVPAYPDSAVYVPLAADGHPLIECPFCHQQHSSRWACDALVAAAHHDGRGDAS